METLAIKNETSAGNSAAKRVGERALWAAGVLTKELGVNDPLTHLEQYLERGEDAIASIDEDLITDIAERKLSPKFVNKIDFDRVGQDFVSRENRVSMRQMTAVTEQKFADSNDNPELYRRARIESLEVSRLSQWFDNAGLNDVFVAESVGLTKAEKYAVVRIYQKTGQNELTENVMPLHNASVDVFNRLHSALEAEVPQSRTPLDLLGNMYDHSPADGNFVEDYVSVYDDLLAAKNPGTEYSFGLPKSGETEPEDDMMTIRRQTALRSVYHDTLRALGNSGGYITPEVISINRSLGGGLELDRGSLVSSAAARELMDRSLQSIVATLNRASQEALDSLAATGDRFSALESASYYGGEARAEGIRYEGACPSGSAAAANAEAAALALGHRFNRDPSQCGTCPRCRKEYYVPEKLYKNKILSCDNCKSAVRFDGRAVNQRIIDDFYGRKQQSSGLFGDLFRTESFAEFWARLAQEQELKKLQRESDLSLSS